MLKYLKFPKIISRNEWDLNANDYLEYKVISKKSDFVVLNNHSFDETKYYWLMNNIAQTIKKLNEKDHIYLIVDIVENFAEIIIGSTYNVENLKLSFSKERFPLSSLSQKKSKIKKKIDLLKKFLQNNDDIIVYLISDNTKSIADAILPEGYIKKEFNEILVKTAFFEEPNSKLLPFVLLGVGFVVLSFFASLLTDNYLFEITETNQALKSRYTKELNALQNKNKKLEKQRKVNLTLENRLSKFKNKLYREK